MAATVSAPPDRAQQVARSTLIVVGGALLSFGIGLLRRRVVAGQFGTAYAFDAYSAVDGLSELMVDTLAVGTLVFAFMPMYIEFLERDQRDQANILASRVINLLSILAGLAAALAGISAPVLVGAWWGIGPGYQPQVQALMVQLVRVYMLSMILFTLSGMVTGILHAHQHFWLPALAPTARSAGIIFGAAVLAPSIGIMGLAWGTVIGAGLHLLVQVPALISYRFRWSLSLNVTDPALRRVMILMAPRIADLLLARATLTWLGANLNSYLGEGKQSAMTYAYSIMNIPWTLVGTAIGFAIFPVFASMAATNDLNAQRKGLSGGLRAVLMLVIPAGVGLLVLGRPVIQILYEGGQFTPESTELVYFALQFYVLALITQSMLDIVVRAFAAQKDTLTPLIVSVFTTAINVALAIWLTRPLAQGGLEHGGPPLANGIAVGIEALTGLTILHFRWKGIDARRIVVDVLKALIAAGVMGGVILAYVTLVHPGPLVLLVTGGILGIVVYCGVALLLGIREIRTIPLSLIEGLFCRKAVQEAGL